MLCALMNRLGKQHIRRSGFDNLPFIHEDHTISHLTGKAHFMGDNHHGHAGFCQFFHQIENAANHFRIERRGCLIKQHHFRVHRQGAGNRHALLLTAGKLARIMSCTFRNTHTRQHILRDFQRFRLGAFQHHSLRQNHIFQRCFMLKQIEMLKHHADFRTGMIEISLRIGDCQIIDGDRAAVDGFQCIERAQQSAFTGAGRADNYQNLPLLYGKRDIPQCTVSLAVAGRRIGLADVLN